MHTPPDGETCTLPEQYFLSVTCLLLLCQKTDLDSLLGETTESKNLRLVWISKQISKHNLSCSDFSCLQNSGGTIMRMESNDLADHQTFLADARKPHSFLI